MILDKQFDRDVIIYAFRYTLPRHTYAPGIMRDKLDEVWDSLDEFAKELVLREIIEHKEFLDRIYEIEKSKGNEEWSFNDKYDLKEWLNWRERRIQMDQNSVNGS